MLSRRTVGTGKVPKSKNMIIGIGIDIIDIDRVKRIADEYGDDMITRIFTEDEIEYCKSKANHEINFAGRFAAKEAFLKALGSGLRSGINWSDIEILRDEFGKPVLFLSGTAKKHTEKLRVVGAHLSISHTAEYAVAVVVLEGYQPPRKTQ